MKWVVLVIGCISQTVFIVVDRKGRYVLAGFLKAYAAACFVTVGAIGMRHAATESFMRFAMLGLFLGMLGDIGMHLRLIFPKSKALTMTIGTLLFLAGHVMYFLALLSLDTTVWLPAIPVCLLVFAPIFVLLKKKVKVGRGFFVLGSCYLAVISYMVAMALVLLMHNLTMYRGMFFCGAVLFLASDVIMVLNLFAPGAKSWYRPFNLGVYYIGQLLIALTVGGIV